MTRMFKWTLGFSIIGLLVSAFLFGYNQQFFNLSESIDAERFSFFGTFISGLAGLLTIWLLYYTYTQTQDTLRVTLETSIDSTFFNLISTYRSIVTQLHTRAETTELRANYSQYRREVGKNSTDKVVKDFFELLYDMLDMKYKLRDNQREMSRLDQFFKDHDWMVGHYFRTLIHLIKWVNDNPDINLVKRVFYIDFIKSQLTLDELRFLYYYSARIDISTFKTLMTYNFFNAAKDQLIYPEDWDEFKKL